MLNQLSNLILIRTPGTIKRVTISAFVKKAFTLKKLLRVQEKHRTDLFSEGSRQTALLPN